MVFYLFVDQGTTKVQKPSLGETDAFTHRKKQKSVKTPIEGAACLVGQKRAHPVHTDFFPKKWRVRLLPNSLFFAVYWRARPDSNGRPTDSKSGALSS
jgi:hypothetical protein